MKAEIAHPLKARDFITGSFMQNLEFTLRDQTDREPNIYQKYQNHYGTKQWKPKTHGNHFNVIQSLWEAVGSCENLHVKDSQTVWDSFARLSCHALTWRTPRRRSLWFLPFVVHQYWSHIHYVVGYHLPCFVVYFAHSFLMFGIKPEPLRYKV